MLKREQNYHPTGQRSTINQRRINAGTIMPSYFSCNFLIFLRFIAGLLFIFLCSGCAPQVKTAAWVIRFDIDSPQKIDRVCNAAKSAGLDELLVQVRGRGDAYYQSSIAPSPDYHEGNAVDFDPLEQTLESCRPLPIHAWLNVYYLWGDLKPPKNLNHPGSPDQPWILKDNNGRSVSDYSAFDKQLGWIEGVYADPASGQYRKLFTEVVNELINNYKVQGIHLDFARYPGAAYGKNDRLAAEFEKIWGLDPRLLPDDLDREKIKKWLNGQQSPADLLLTTGALFWNELRAQQITRLIREVRATINSHRNGRGQRAIRFTAAVFPDASEAYLTKGQDWQSWADQGLVDGLYPMAYFGDLDRVTTQLDQVASEVTPQVELWAGLGAYIKDPQRIAEETAIARRNGYQGIVLFSLGHLLDKDEPISAYTEAARAPLFTLQSKIASSKAQCYPGSDNPSLKVCTTELTGIVYKSFSNSPPFQSDLEQILSRRLAEYRQAMPMIGQSLNLLQKTTLTLPEQIELRGIFRYTSPLDSENRWQQQRQTCEEARQLLESGEPFGIIAKKMSQGGTKSMGGLLGSRFIDQLDPIDRQLALLQPQQISPVIEVANGFWVYRLDSKETGKPIEFEKTPWPARRILFRQQLTETLQSQAADINTLAGKQGN